MIRNYLKIAWRVLTRHKVYAVINVGGLAIGLAVALLIGLFVWDEVTRDGFHEQGDRIFRLIGHESPDGTLTANMDAPLAPLLDEHLPQIETYARTARRTVLVGAPGQQTEQSVLLADPSFLQVFSFPLASGSAANVLSSPDAVVISEELAKHLFGSVHAIGETLPVQFRRGETRELTVTGVIGPVPPASVTFDLLVPFEMLRHTGHPQISEMLLTHRRGRLGDTYLLLGSTESADGLEMLINDVVESSYGDVPTAYTGAADIERYSLQPLSDVYLTPDVASSVATSNDPRYSLLLGGIGLLVLLLACINFAALAIGRSVDRAREVGMRKALGARPRQLRWQFWSEALLVTSIALVLGLFVAQLALPAFNTLADKSLTLSPLAAPGFIACVAAGLVLVSLVAGAYPAWMLSRFAPTPVLRGAVGGGRRHRIIRGLVVVQFAISIGLLIGAIVMAEQLRHVQKAELGFDRHQVLLVENQSGENLDVVVDRLRHELSAYSEIEQVSGISQAFERRDAPYVLTAGDTVRTSIHERSVDWQFRETMGIALLAGRDPDAGRSREDGGQVLVNEALIRAMGWSAEEALGRNLEPEVGNFTLFAGEIVGIVENFNFHSLHYDVEPLMMMVGATGFAGGQALIRYTPDQTATALARIEDAWRSVATDAPFLYRFLDEEIHALYEADRRWALLVRYAVSLALLISCFGLFGLSALAAQRRTKEIGIRKVLGATVPNIVALLSKDLALPVGMAFLIAAPVAYLAMNRWLEDFAYRIELGPGMFAIAGVLALAIALLTVSYHAVKAAWTDPARSLRYE